MDENLVVTIKHDMDKPTKPLSSTQHPLLTLPLPLFISNHLEEKWCKPVDKTIGSVIAKQIDPQEIYCHIEFWFPNNILDIEQQEIIFECRPSEKNPAILWEIKAWRDSVSYREKRRLELSKDSAEYIYLKKKIAELSIALHEQLALPYNGEHGSIALATKIVSSRNKTGAKNFGVDL